MAMTRDIKLSKLATRYNSLHRSVRSHDSFETSSSQPLSSHTHTHKHSHILNLITVGVYRRLVNVVDSNCNRRILNSNSTITSSVSYILFKYISILVYYILVYLNILNILFCSYFI